jgi:hypothetical protein
MRYYPETAELDDCRSIRSMVHGSDFREFFRKFQIFAGPTAVGMVPQNSSSHPKDSPARGA